MGRPAGFNQTLMDRYQSATVADLDRVDDTWLDFGPAPVVVVVGTPAGGAKSLEALGLGPVTVLEPIDFGH